MVTNTATNCLWLILISTCDVSVHISSPTSNVTLLTLFFTSVTKAKLNIHDLEFLLICQHFVTYPLILILKVMLYFFHYLILCNTMRFPRRGKIIGLYYSSEHVK